MSKRDSFIVIAISIFVLIVVNMIVNSAKNEYISSDMDIKKFKVEASAISNLKRKFNKKNYEKVLKSIDYISHPTKDIKKSNTRVLMYENLTVSSLSNILRKIENSTLLIKRLEITRVSGKNANLRLEISQ